jgi:multisubunit Na+/H+ antiporter MnhF subunit
VVRLCVYRMLPDFFDRTMLLNFFRTQTILLLLNYKRSCRIQNRIDVDCAMWLLDCSGLNDESAN